MTGPAHIAVIDIGKTNAKLALVEMETLAEIAVLTRPNHVRPGPPWPHFDLDGHRAFLIAGLADLHRAHGIDAISITTHGASIVLLDRTGALAAPTLDYEHPGPDSLAAAYDAIRPDFAETGSPRLPMGLNVGAQIHWQTHTDPGLNDRIAHILGYPQYWGHWLTGELASDVTSLGCHTDLWNPHARGLSSLADRLGIADRIATPRRPAEVLGQLRPDIARATGLPVTTPVAVGIHDSNASLLPHLMIRPAPFSVVSSGTWVIAMTIGGDPVDLDETRDLLINVNAFGDPVRSARFMGGREYETIAAGDHKPPSEADVNAILTAGTLLLPSVVTGSGPFPTRQATWSGDPPNGGPRAAALAFYLALMTATCLRLTGHKGAVIVEGPFARNAPYLDMLSAATRSPVAASTSATGTSTGAGLLLAPGATETLRARAPVPRHRGDARMAAYAALWQQAVG